MKPRGMLASLLLSGLVAKASPFVLQAAPAVATARSGVVRKMSASGHQPPAGAPKRSPEEEELSKKIQEHQQGAARLSKTEEVRTLIEYNNGFGVISTNSKDGYPNGAVAGFGLDPEGRPLFAFSSMSSHTTDLKSDGRASLTVTSNTFKGAADGRVTLTGDIGLVPAEEKEEVKAMYKKKHPNAFWVDFGDFSFMRMDKIKSIRFVGGFAMAGDIEPEEYASTKPDPITAFAEPIAGHMNKDHSSSTVAIVEHLITGPGIVEGAEITGVDRLGMYVVTTLKGGEKGKLRVPFSSPAEDRKAVKERIVELTQAAAGGGGAEESA